MDSGESDSDEESPTALPALIDNPLIADRGTDVPSPSSTDLLPTPPSPESYGVKANNPNVAGRVAKDLFDALNPRKTRSQGPVQDISLPNRPVEYKQYKRKQK